LALRRPAGRPHGQHCASSRGHGHTQVDLSSSSVDRPSTTSMPPRRPTHIGTRRSWRRSPTLPAERGRRAQRGLPRPRAACRRRLPELREQAGRAEGRIRVAVPAWSRRGRDDRSWTAVQD